MNRLSAIRGPAKSMAMSEIASYELGKSGKCEARVAVLFKFHQYIFPGTWTGENGLVRIHISLSKHANQSVDMEREKKQALSEFRGYRYSNSGVLRKFVVHWLPVHGSV